MPLPEKLQAARLLCSERWPYVSQALWAIQPVEQKGLGTLGVDKWWRMYYDPEVPWSVEECAAVFYHEIQHLLRKHPDRAETIAGVDTQAWNVAADAEINDDIAGETTQGKVKLPDKAIYPRSLQQPDGLLAEEYYNNIPRITIKVACASGGECGSAAGGSKRGYELDGPGQGSGSGEKNDNAPGLSEGEADLVRHQIAATIQSSARGDIPDYMKRWAKEILEP